MTHYIANLRDIEFTLFDLLKRDEILEKGPFAEVDRATAMGMLEEVKRLAEVVIWPWNAVTVLSAKYVYTVLTQ